MLMAVRPSTLTMSDALPSASAVNVAPFWPTYCMPDCSWESFISKDPAFLPG